jgi:hypothetical protein
MDNEIYSLARVTCEEAAPPEEPTCSECGCTDEWSDTEYGSLRVPVTLDPNGTCAECAYKILTGRVVR